MYSFFVEQLTPLLMNGSIRRLYLDLGEILERIAQQTAYTFLADLQHFQFRKPYLVALVCQQFSQVF